MKKLNGTKIGRVVNLVLEGNAYQKEFPTNEEAAEFFKLMQLARTGDETALDKIRTQLNRAAYRKAYKGILEEDSEGRIFLKGIDVPMPELMITTFADYIDNGLNTNALVNFWKLLVTNPDTRVREDLFKFLSTYNFALTDYGYFIAYKALLVKEGPSRGEDIVAFVTNSYVKVKKWKKNPANFDVIREFLTVETEVENPAYKEWQECINQAEIDEYEDDNGSGYRDSRDDDDDDDDSGYYNGGDGPEAEYETRTNGEPKFIKGTKEVPKLRLVEINPLTYPAGHFDIIGTLDEVFKNIDQYVDARTVYESRHSGPDGRVEQVLGEPVRMERAQTNLDPSVECSSGLHVGSIKYVEKFANSEDKILLCLVNPAHVVAVPRYDNSKLRTCEYFPYAELDRNENGTFEVVEEPYFEEDFMKYEAAELASQLEKIQTELSVAGEPSKEQLDYKKILEDRLISIEEVLLKK